MLGNSEIVITMDLGNTGIMMEKCLWENLRMIAEKKEIDTNWKKMTLTHSIISSVIRKEKFQES
jgi:predicted DNA-binding ribbon-helix-helix protein